MVEQARTRLPPVAESAGAELGEQQVLPVWEDARLAPERTGEGVGGPAEVTPPGVGLAELAVRLGVGGPVVQPRVAEQPPGVGGGGRAIPAEPEQRPPPAQVEWGVGGAERGRAVPGEQGGGGRARPRTP